MEKVCEKGYKEIGFDLGYIDIPYGMEYKEVGLDLGYIYISYVGNEI